MYVAACNGSGIDNIKNGIHLKNLYDCGIRRLIIAINKLDIHNEEDVQNIYLSYVTQICGILKTT